MQEDGRQPAALTLNLEPSDLACSLSLAILADHREVMSLLPTCFPTCRRLTQGSPVRLAVGSQIACGTPAQRKALLRRCGSTLFDTG